MRYRDQVGVFNSARLVWQLRPCRCREIKIRGMDEKKNSGRREVASVEVAPTSFPGAFPFKIGKGKSPGNEVESRPKTGKWLWKREGVRVRGRSTAIRPGF